MTHNSDTKKFDYIIVGAGSAGCVLANRLSKDPHATVLLIEAGGRDTNPWIHVPVGYLYTRGKASTDWCYATEPEKHLANRRLPYPRGRVLGGCSSINGMVYTRGHASDYDRWAAEGNPGWGWSDVLPLFMRSEKYAGRSPWHGMDGEWHVEDRKENWPILEAVRDAGAFLGIPRNIDFNSGETFGSGYYQINQNQGWRSSLATAMLRPARRRANLTVVTGAVVDRVLFDGRRASGVAYSLNGQKQTASVRAEVILTAGAVGSPAILQRSGVGPAGLLADLGIPVVVDLPGVGADLQDHMQTRIVTRVSNTATMNERAGSLFHRALMGLQYALFRTGPLAMIPSQLGGFAKSSLSPANPDLQFFVQMGSMDATGKFQKFPAVTVAICNLQPKSRGHVRITSRAADKAPEIVLNYLSNPDDRQIMVEAVKLVRKIWDAPSLQHFLPDEVTPGRRYVSSEDILREGAAISSAIFHPTSTCRMGQDDLAVVDHTLKVRGLDGLRVADASIMPRITSANTNAPTVMIAEKAADLIIQDRAASTSALSA